MHDAIKRVAQRIAPRLFLKMQRQWGDAGSDYRVERALRRAGAWDTVAAGPFKGMRYTAESAGSTRYTKTLGTYEVELVPVVEEIIQKRYPLIVDVGCAEGYYAVGLAYRQQSSRVIAFDADVRARELCQQLATLNQCADRVTIRGTCGHDELSEVLAAGSLLICDCEGCEIELLDSDRVPVLSRCDILVELHDCFVPGLSEKVLPRFAATHSIQVINTAPRALGSSPTIRKLKPVDQMTAFREWRPGPMSWAWMKAKNP